MIVFLSGGARSGKSALAESLTLKAGREHCYYVATASESDGEMRERIARHRRGRDRRFITREAALELDEVVAGIPEGQAVLVDCLTLWANRLLFSAGLDAFEAEQEGEKRLKKLLGEARARRLHLVIVSNDLNEAMLPANPGVWRYVDFLQRQHRLLAGQADSVIEVIAGRGIEWKRAALSQSLVDESSP